MTPAQVREYLQISDPTLDKYCKAGLLVPAYLPGNGGKWRRFRRSDVYELLALAGDLLETASADA